MSQDDQSPDIPRKPSPFDADNPFAENPYATPETVMATGKAASSRSDMVRHVPVVAVLMVVQGVAELVMALFLVGMAFALPIMMKSQLGQQPQPPAGPTPEMMSSIMTVMYVAFALMVLCGAILHIFAGLRNFAFRSRVLGIVALIVGMLTTLMTCYCAPTAVGLGVYGLICYLNPQVTEAFTAVNSGSTKQQVLERHR
jgi:hypothetical protein